MIMKAMIPTIIVIIIPGVISRTACMLAKVIERTITLGAQPALKTTSTFTSLRFSPMK